MTQFGFGDWLLSRRGVMQLAGAAALIGVGSKGAAYSKTHHWMAMANGAARWLNSVKTETPAGQTWPQVPGSSRPIDLSLYHGSPGIVLFFLELFHATKNHAYLHEATRGGDHLLVAARENPGSSAGLYSGSAGWAYCFAELYRAGGQSRFREAASEMIERVMAQSREMGKGIAWTEPKDNQVFSDIVYGSAGIGLTLLYADERLREKRALEYALRAGDYLLSAAIPHGGGLKWNMTPDFPRLMPNFSHGTAGIGYFLARLYERTRHGKYLDAAIKSAVYLEDIARCDKNGCLVFHHEPGGENLFYLSWCHGPAGSSRLFYQLLKTTDEVRWRTAMRRSAAGIVATGAPQDRSPGYWNNISQCCGDSGIGEYFLAMAAMTRVQGYRSSANRFGDYVARWADKDKESGGLRWIQAENRREPDAITAQTGWMQGAAGVGAFFLRLDGAASGRKSKIVFPDSPWGGLI